MLRGVLSSIYLTSILLTFNAHKHVYAFSVVGVILSIYVYVQEGYISKNV